MDGIYWEIAILVQIVLIVLGKAPLIRNVIALNQLNITVTNSLG